MRDTRPFKSMDANAAAGHVAYAFTEVAAIYPITPSSPMRSMWTNGPTKTVEIFLDTASISWKWSPRPAPQARSMVPCPPAR